MGDGSLINYKLQDIRKAELSDRKQLLLGSRPL